MKVGNSKKSSAPRGIKPYQQPETLVEQVLAMKRYGLGEFTVPEIETWVARQVMFYYIERDCQDSLMELHGSAFAPYVRLFQSAKAKYPRMGDFPEVCTISSTPTFTRRKLHVIDSWDTLSHIAVFDPNARACLVAMGTWASLRDVKVKWMLDEMLWNVVFWNLHGDGGGKLSWRYRGSLSQWASGTRVASGPPIRPGLFEHARDSLLDLVPPPLIQPLSPLGQTFAEHRDQVSSGLTEYYKRCTTALNRLGVADAKAKRTTSTDPWIQANRFIRYQIKRETLFQIAEAESGANESSHNALGEDAVYHSVAAYAKTVGLKLRRRSQRRGAANLK